MIQLLCLANGTEFSLMDDVNFKVSSSLDPMKVEVLQPKFSNIPTNYRLTKKVLAKSGTRKTETFAFTTGKKFDKIVLSNDKVTEIVSVWIVKITNTMKFLS